MSERATLSKPELKKMFLKVLYEILYGKMKGHSSGIDSIVPSWMNEYYEMKMTKEEKQSTYEAIQELKTQGLIVKDSSQSEDVYQVLTEKGKEIVERMQNPDAYALRLEEVIPNPTLLSICLNDFNEEDYDTAIFKAFRFIEEQVRVKSGANAGDIGVNLITKAFSPSNGLLKVLTCVVPAEQEGIASLFRGAISEFKNPSSHRTVNYTDRKVVIEIIALADLLLDILSKTVRRTP